MNRSITLLIMILLGQVSKTAGTCKSHLLRSYSFVGLNVPSSSHVLCPKIKSNCCKTDDILKQHKWYHTYLKTGIKAHHEQSLNGYNKLDKLFSEINKIDFEGIEKAYKNYLQPEAAKNNETEKKTTEKKEEATKRKLRLKKQRKRMRRLAEANKTQTAKPEEKKAETKKTETKKTETKKATTPVKKLTKEEEESLAKLTTLISELKDKKAEELKKKHTDIGKELEKMFKQVSKFRLGIFCTLCDGENHKYFDLEEMNITYSAAFCTQLIGAFLNPLHDKYVELIKYMINFSDFTYIIAKKKLINDAGFEKKAKEYIALLEKCKKKPGDLAECHQFCTEFQINKLGLLFDGEGKILEDYAKNYNELSAMLTDKTKHTEIFNERARMLKEEEASVKFLANHNFLKKDINKPDDLKAIKTNSFNKHSEVRSIQKLAQQKQFFKDQAPNSGGRPLTSLSLYSVAPKPIEISKLKVLINQDGGLNFFTDSERVDFDIKKDQLITLLSEKKKNEGVSGETIDTKIIKLLEQNGVNNLRSYLNDSHIDFTPYMHPDYLKVEKKKKKLIGTKKRTDIIGIFIVFVLAGVLSF